MITSIDGSITDITTARNSAGINTDSDYTSTVSGSITSSGDLTNLNSLVVETSGVVSATLSGSTSYVDGLSSDSNDSITITLSSGSATASQLNSIDSKTAVSVGAQAITAISGSLADVHTARTSAGITTDTDYTASISNTLANGDIANLNALAAETSGLVTATLSGVNSTQADSLSTAGTDAITINLSGGSSTAALLNSLDGKTSVSVNASAISAISGT